MCSENLNSSVLEAWVIFAIVVNKTKMAFNVNKKMISGFFEVLPQNFRE